MFEKHGINEYARILEKFLMNISSLRYYTESVESLFENLNEKDEITESEGLVKTIHFFNYLRKHENEEDEQIIEIKKVIEDFLWKNYSVEILEDSAQIKIKAHAKDAKKVDSLFTDFKLIMNRENILYQSSIINLVVFFELLVANLIKKRIIDNPNSANIKNKSLSLEDIISLGSLENAEMYLIEHEVESIIRSSYDKWMDYLKKNTKCEFKYLNTYQDEISEVFQRRNLIVHNEGIVNNTYISKVSQKYKENVKIGQSIDIEKEYLDNSINLLELIGCLIGIDLWRNMEKFSQDRQNFLIDFGFKFMEEKKWYIAKEMYNFLMIEKNLSSSDFTLSKINYWLCCKNIDGLESIKLDLNKQDFSDKRNIFQLCMYALKDEFDEFYNILPIVYGTELKLEDLEEWPVFSTVRTDDRFEKFMEKHKNNKEIEESE